MVFWRLKCVSPGYAGPFRLWLRRTCLFVVCCVMSVSCFACMLWHVAVCFLWLDTKWFSSLLSVCFDVCFCSGFRPSAIRFRGVRCKHYGCFMVQCVIVILYAFLLEIEFVQPLFCLLFGTFFTKQCKNIGFTLPFDVFRYVKGKLSHPYWPAFAAWNVAFRAAFRWFLLHILSVPFVSSGIAVFYDCTRFVRYFKPYACLFLKNWVLEPYCKSKSKRFAAYSVNVSCAAVACLIVICLLLLDLVVCCGRLVLLSILCFVCFGIFFCVSSNLFYVQALSVHALTGCRPFIGSPDK